MSRDDQRRIDRQPSLLERTQIALIPLDDLGRLDIAQERDPPSPQPCEMRRRAPAAAQIIAADRAIALLGQLRPPHHEAAFLLRELVELGEQRSEEHTSELQSLMRISYAVFCLTKKTN